MTSGNRQGSLYDISLNGARFTTSNPPATGTSGLLAWNTHEAFGKIIWSNEDGCGIEFERQIPQEAIEELTAASTGQTRRAANFGNIPIARKGRRGLVSGN